MAQDSGDWVDRAQSLLQVVKDLALMDRPRANSRGSARHLALFEQYTRVLGEQKLEAERWFNVLIASEEEETGDRDQAIENVWERRPVGPLSHPKVTGAVRKFWLACVSLNEEVPETERVAPEEFVLLWLMHRGHDELAEFVTGYPFWPVGLDHDGRWI
jgi:hypothetical protein